MPYIVKTTRPRPPCPDDEAHRAMAPLRLTVASCQGVTCQGMRDRSTIHQSKFGEEDDAALAAMDRLGKTTVVLSDVAFATPGEVRRSITAEVVERHLTAAEVMALDDDVAEKGGKLPLPDGTTIEVTPIEPQALLLAFRPHAHRDWSKHYKDVQALCDAYNAERSSS